MEKASFKNYVDFDFQSSRINSNDQLTNMSDFWISTVFTQPAIVADLKILNILFDFINTFIYPSATRGVVFVLYFQDMHGSPFLNNGCFIWFALENFQTTSVYNFSSIKPDCFDKHPTIFKILNFCQEKIGFVIKWPRSYSKTKWW